MLKFFIYNFDERMTMQPLSDFTGEAVTVNGKRSPCRDSMLIRRTQYQRVQAPHFFLENTDRIPEAISPQRVAAYELGEFIRVVGRRLHNRSHLIQPYRHSARSDLPGCLAAGQSCSNDGDRLNRAG
ncbi:hypothetical protein D3C71_1190620 [compost metagenome]